MNVVLCCDGTGNKLDVATINVVRLFSIAKRDSPSEQVVYYHPGIGTMPARAALTLPSRGATRLAGNVAGYGLLDDVADLYTYVMRALATATASSSSGSAAAHSRSGGLTVHESVPEDLLTELRRKDHALRFLTSREKTLTRSSPGAPGGTMRAGSREGGG